MSEANQDNLATPDPLAIPAWLKERQAHGAEEAASEAALGPVPDNAFPGPSTPPPTVPPSPQQCEHPMLGIPTCIWAYHNANDALVGGVARFETVNEEGEKKKEIRPFLLNGDARATGTLEWRAPAEPRPLYNLKDLLERGNAHILVVEGEKSADAARQLFVDHVVTTSMGGSSAPDKSDWQPLGGRDVTIWPDADNAGRTYAESVAEHALRAGAARVRIVDVPAEFPGGWDLADAPPIGWATDKLTDLLTSAEHVVDPLDGLVEKATHDPGAAFAPEVLARLSGLRESDLARYESVRKQLKDAGVRVPALE